MVDRDGSSQWAGDNVVDSLAATTSAAALAWQMRSSGIEALILCQPDGRILAHRTERSLAHEARPASPRGTVSKPLVLPKPRAAMDDEDVEATKTSVLRPIHANWFPSLE